MFSIILVIILIINPGCGIRKNDINQFSSSIDTLVIRTQKQKGGGLFTLGAFSPNFKDSTEEFTYSVKYPNKIIDIKRVQMSTDFKAVEAHYVDIMNGKRGKEKIFVVDENNNKDFTDDSVRIYQGIKWRSSVHLIKCKYLISNGQEIVEDSSWIKMGTYNNNLLYGRSEHLTANFRIDKEIYKVGIIDARTGDFIYGVYPEIALLSHNTIAKDTLLERDILKQGELLNLSGNYYRFEYISNNGEYITLIKEKDFNKETGTQVGMIAPDFECLSVAGDTVRSSTLNDRIMVIANSCGCGGDQYSTEACYDILKEFGDKIHILHLDSKIDKGLEGFHIDMEEKFNSDIYYKYRNTYCSRICYVIDKNNRIIDRFPVSDWKSYLPKHIKSLEN